MIYKKHILVLLFFPFLTALLCAVEKKMTLGGDKGWPAFLRSDHIAKTSGRFGKEALCIAGAAASVTPDTDLLLNFEDGRFSDLCENYTLVSSALNAIPDAIMGKYAALGKGAQKGLTLKGGSKSIFGRSGPIGSFTLSFWLKPALTENGESVFSWRSSRNIDGAPEYQMIAAAFFNNKIEWAFTNVFSSANSLKDVTLTGKNSVIPNVWAFHTLTFDEETGLLEYRINGKTEALCYTTSSGKSSGTVFIPVLGVPAEMEICPAFTGLIDEFCLRKTVAAPDYRLPLFNPNGAYFESRPLGPFPPGTVITGVHALTDIPEQTDVQFFVRASDNYHTWTESTPEWTPAENGAKIRGIGGVWLQVAASLYTDGAGTKTPSVTEITISYKEKDPPLPPVRLFAEAGDGYADISWIASAGTAVSGYMVYYGEKPGEYLGQQAFEGASPIDAGQKLSLRLSGLKNGKIYYFAVSAYEDAGVKIEGILSKEIYARPLKKKSKTKE